MPTTRVEARDDGSGETMENGCGPLPGRVDPSGGVGAWKGHGLSTGGHDVVFGRSSLQNKSGSGPPGGALHFFWRDGGVGGSGMVSHLANQFGSIGGDRGSSASPMSRRPCFDDVCIFVRYDRNAPLCAGTGKRAFLNSGERVCPREIHFHEPVVSRNCISLGREILGRFERTQS